MAKKWKKLGVFGQILCAVALVVGLIPNLLGLKNDHPVEEIAEDILTSSLCMNCDVDLDLSPGESGIFSEDDKKERAKDTPKIKEDKEEVAMPPLPAPSSDVLK